LSNNLLMLCKPEMVWLQHLSVTSSKLT